MVYILLPFIKIPFPGKQFPGNKRWLRLDLVTTKIKRLWKLALL